jgi:hypothetical protein
MGYTSYSSDSRNLRFSREAESRGLSATTDALTGNTFLNMADTRTMKAMFTQEDKQDIHPEMNPKGLKFRECRDSEAHPNTVPILVGLDVTGSMGTVPKEFVANGLPTMMSTIIQRGTPDAAVCFMGIGDHVYDKAPIQVGQFESGDAELDMWLGRTWLEGRGGPNPGESYMLPWYVAAFHTKTDACEKRNKKGFLFTVGDEPCLPGLPASAIKQIFGDGEAVQADYTSAQLLEEAKKCYNVYHIALSSRDEKGWKKLLGQNYLPCDHYSKVPALIADIVNSFNEREGLVTTVVGTPGTGKTSSPEEPKITL